jgi:glucose dehydrogenase
MTKSTLLRLFALVVLAAVTLSGTSANTGGNVDWGVHRGDAKGTQYSPLAQIHAANVHELQPACSTTPATPISVRRCT